MLGILHHYFVDLDFLALDDEEQRVQPPERIDRKVLDMPQGIFVELASQGRRRGPRWHVIQACPPIPASPHSAIRGHRHGKET